MVDKGLVGSVEEARALVMAGDVSLPSTHGRPTAGQQLRDDQEIVLRSLRRGVREGDLPDLVVIELGANDGFRGIPTTTIEKNLRAIIKRVRERGARPLLLGIRLPPNYGAEYAAGFDAIYPRLAEELTVAFVPSFMEGVAGDAELNLPDGIHPTPEGHRRLAKNLEKPLADLLRELRAAAEEE